MSFVSADETVTAELALTSAQRDENNRRATSLENKFRRWFFEGVRRPKPTAHHKDAWGKIMCLTGVDYFSTLGYQPGIAFLAAGLLSPLATLTIVLLTLFGALPVYYLVARESPHGQGSISMIERLLPGWRGKALVLALLGFAATDFIITITLSAADATAHVVENPLLQTLPSWALDKVVVTLILLLVLGGVFLKGFREAIGVSVIIVFSYLLLNVITLSVDVCHLFGRPDLFASWQSAVVAEHGSFWGAIGLSLLLFPKLALGMSGFETGVAVMPLVKGEDSDTDENPAGRVRNTRKLLLAAAVIMSCFLLVSSVTTTLLIPPEAFKEGGAANGRAISYLAHQFLGHSFGTVYDISTILILWFAGASAMAGLLTLVPTYLPRYGMAPAWSSAVRPLVAFFTFVAVIVTVVFRADVDAQAGAYATGVLVLMSSAAIAVTLSARKKLYKILLGIIALVFIYTTIVNMMERPEGIQIASFFIGAILVVSLISRAVRSTELRIANVILDDAANRFIDESMKSRGDIDLLAHRPGGSTDYQSKESETRRIHKLTQDEASFIFLEVDLGDPSQFQDDCLRISGHEVGGFKVLKCQSAAIPNAIAAILLHIRDTRKTIPHVYFGWTEGHPLSYVFKYIFLGEGETAPVTREILRALETNPAQRPRIIVG